MSNPIRHVPFAFWMLPIFFGGAALFWMLRPWAIQSGDYEEYTERKRYGWSQPIYHIREPGAVLLWQGFAWGAKELFRGQTGPGTLTPEDRRRGFDLTGAFCGGWFLVFLVGFIRAAPEAARLRQGIAAAVVLLSAVTWTFVGHIEFYAPLYAGLMFYYWRIACFLNRPTRGNFAALALGIGAALLMHRVAIFQMPALALLWVRPGRPPQIERPESSQISTLLGLVIVLCALHFIPIFIAAAFNRGFLVFEDYNWLPELVTPLTQGWADYVEENSKLGSYHLFTFASRAHWEHFFFFLMVASPLGIPVALVLRRSMGDRISSLLLAASLCGWVWALIWHPHLGYGDWDLFVNPGLPTNLLAAWLILKSGNPRATPA